MKVTVKGTIDMTPEQVAAYACEYGLDGSDVQAVRDDIRTYVETALQGCPAGEFWTFTLAATR